MTDDDPIDLVQVGADDAALDAVLAGRVADDLALLLLRDLLEDVSEQPAPAPVGCGSTVLTLASDRTPERRTVRNGTLVAAVTAGLLSLSGAAAASTLAPDGSRLAGLGDVVRSAVGAAVESVTPPDPVVPAPASRVEAPAARATAPAVTATAPVGAAVSATARSQAAARQVTALLDAAAAKLREGRAQAASAQLDTAERRLADVLPAAAAPLAERLAGLREQVAAAATPAQKPAPKQQAPQQPGPREQQPRQQPPKQQARQDPPPKAEPAQEQSRSERQPSGKGGGDAPPRGSDRAAEPSAPQVRGEVRRQLSSDASTKPRA